MLAGLTPCGHSVASYVMCGIGWRDVSAPPMAACGGEQLVKEHPAVTMSPADADLGAYRRGVEPVRVVVMGQPDRKPIAHGARRDTCILATDVFTNPPC
jgi:hypothetical protein